MLIAMNPINRKQYYFLGHTATISNVVISKDGSLIATSQLGGKPLVLIWEIQNQKSAYTY